MARNLFDSIGDVRNLNNVIARLSTVNLPLALGQTRGISVGNNFRERERILQINGELDSILAVIRKSNQVIRAENFMLTNGGKGDTPSSILARWDRARVRRRGEQSATADANQSLKDTLLSIENPAEYERNMLVRRFGKSSVGGDEAANRILAARRKDRDAAFARFMLPGFESERAEFIHAKTGEGFTKDQANQMWIRKEFGNGVLAKIAKSNPKVADNLIKLNKGLRKSPFIGAFVRHPLIAGMSALTTTALQYGGAIARASKESVKILNSERLLGGISSGEFSGGATAGFDFLTTLRALGGVTANVAGWKYGEGLQGLYKAAMYGMDIAGWNPFMGRDEMLKWAIPQLGKLPEGERKKAADALGISEEAFNIGKNNMMDPMFMTNEQLMGAMWQNTLNERRKKRTSGDFVKTALSFLNPFESDTFGESLNALFFHRPAAYNLIEKMRATQEAASSVGSYSAGGMSQSLAGGDTDNSTTMYIDKMVLPNATDADGIKRDAKSESSRYVSRLRTVKRISTGVR